MKRPTIYDEAVIVETVEHMLPEVLGWLEADEKEGKEISEQLVNVLQDSYEYDGYKLAKKLDDDYMWSSDAELVEILETVSNAIFAVCTQQTNKWVLENNIKPQYAINDRVTYKNSNKTTNGVIVDIQLEMGNYLIQNDGEQYSPARYSKTLDKEFKCGSIVPFEDCSKIEETV